LKIFKLSLSKYFKENTVANSLQLKVWTLIAYVAVMTLISIWLHEGTAPSSLLMAAGAFG